MTQADETQAKKYERPVKEVTWLERTMPVYEPSEEQFTAILRLSRLPNSDEVSLKRMLGTLNRVPELCRMLLADEDDQEWLEDSIAFSRIKLDQLPDLLVSVITVWWGEQNRSTRRRAAKKTSARLAR